jgi:hypothetical protein
MCLFRHVTAAQRDTFLQAATNFLRDSPSPRISFVGFTRRPAAIRRPLGRFFVALELSDSCWFVDEGRSLSEYRWKFVTSELFVCLPAEMLFKDLSQKWRS